ncbi:MAG: type II toxin-antitoxin system VapC family toxin [Anaerolineales bacterium]
MATSRLVVDSDVVIDQLRQHEFTLQRAVEHFDCALSAIGFYELNAAPHQTDQQREALTEILTVVDILAFDRVAASQAAQISRQLARQGRMIGVPDLLTAGICLANDLPLLTRNADHFGRIEGLRLVTPDSLQAHIDASR